MLQVSTWFDRRIGNRSHDQLFELYILALLSLIAPMSIFPGEQPPILLVWEACLSTVMCTAITLLGLQPSMPHPHVDPNFKRNVTILLGAVVAIKVVAFFTVVLPARFGGKVLGSRDHTRRKGTLFKKLGEALGKALGKVGQVIDVLRDLASTPRGRQLVYAPCVAAVVSMVIAVTSRALESNGKRIRMTLAAAQGAVLGVGVLVLLVLAARIADFVKSSSPSQRRSAIVADGGLLFTAAMQIFDQVTDVLACVNYYHEAMWGYFFAAVNILAVAQLVGASASSIGLATRLGPAYRGVGFVSGLIGVAVPWSAVRCVLTSVPQTEFASLKFLQSVLEAVPQFVMSSVYIYNLGFGVAWREQPVMVFSALSSLHACASGFVAYELEESIEDADIPSMQQTDPGRMLALSKSGVFKSGLFLFYAADLLLRALAVCIVGAAFGSWAWLCAGLAALANILGMFATVVAEELEPLPGQTHAPELLPGGTDHTETSPAAAAPAAAPAALAAAPAMAPATAPLSTQGEQVHLYVLALLVVVPLTVFKRNIPFALIVWEGLSSTILAVGFSLVGLVQFDVDASFAALLTTALVAAATVKMLSFAEFILPNKYGHDEVAVLGVPLTSAGAVASTLGSNGAGAGAENESASLDA